MKHGRPIVYIDNINYEGYCYYAKDSNEKILFFDTDLEQHKKMLIKMPKQVNAEKVMKSELSSTK
ncbi:hypothetical protein FOH38_22435 [Lysinibacillus fusiformis]|nr:hypothetical protein FOH38_22435 [Lysinibacillus fusiformis]